ncbi:MAG: hypothetical protein A2431_03740 [Candidatus Zambryskibacteria bacterium RIFOXYC1_FULL_39_10]|uniref:Uncharacterized protein n=1 Tax=Candidatus Zambryskibacteria bacterium RIFOXYC1_FULL_39_10 TaxID=1802779 RepID=A0A1G2V174_9BACT|nr:MAG: hypothetical protein A2431_03740 [Candidatus Zambryskibacteria bacterium RIFOXYC1_FULL_39_10]OHB16463.1 MAG: hypothetical protein A2605_01445 [Candidatus Zambryskibacteria bacterium RIFOXYD1_FULL_39_35]
MQRFFIKILAGWLILSSFVITLLNFNNEIGRARLFMAWGLILIWVVLGGYIMYKYKDTFKSIFEKIPGKWTIKFFLFCVVLALIEEAVATLLTNMAPVFGAQIGEAYITASTNFLQVVLHHSVIIFLPFFIAWVWLLKRYDFSANQAFWFFGITGTLAEAVSFGNIAEFGLWIFVYGLMIYLPTYCIPKDRGAKPVRIWHYPLVIVAPIFFLLCLFVLASLWKGIGLPTIPNFGTDLINR